MAFVCIVAFVIKVIPIQVNNGIVVNNIHSRLVNEYSAFILITVLNTKYSSILHKHTIKTLLYENSPIRFSVGTPEIYDIKNIATLDSVNKIAVENKIKKI